MPVRRRQVVRALLSLVLLALLVLYARSLNWPTVWNDIRTASLPLLLLSALANLVTVGSKAIVWWIFLRGVGAPSLGLSLRATVSGAALNNLVIANGGDAARAVFVARGSDASGAAVLAALTLERLFDFIGYTLVVAAAAFLLPMPASVARWRGLAVIVLLAIVALLWFLLVRVAEAPVAPASRPTTLVARASAFFARYTHKLSGMVTLPRLAAAFALTLVNWGSQIASYHWAAMATHFPITVAGSIAAMITSNVGFLMRLTPGNVGLFQFVYALTAQALGLPKDAAVSTALLLQIVQNVPVVLLGTAVSPALVLRREPATETQL
ncbi:MAG TPA: lysylphosphatidylglycerol synthase transmembrane domain-containing protein [Gemmatimonadaceae bacterium]|nr:lysylphosphatidylglycerol synthase transmembrane domain-containing protein [Gemmatimonadaceae bacterium]